jgi:hypothetical protein
MADAGLAAQRVDEDLWKVRTTNREHRGRDVASRWI